MSKNMKLFVSRLALAGTTAVALAIPNAALAGRHEERPFKCAPDVLGHDACTGTLRSAQESPNSDDYAYFTLGESGTLQFFAKFLNTTYTCIFNEAQSQALGAAAIAAGPDTSFRVVIGRDGMCFSGVLKNSSTLQAL